MPIVLSLIFLVLFIWVIHATDLPLPGLALSFGLLIGTIILGSIVGGIVARTIKEDRDIRNSNPDSSEDIPN